MKYHTYILLFLYVQCIVIIFSANITNTCPYDFMKMNVNSVETIEKKHNDSKYYHKQLKLNETLALCVEFQDNTKLDAIIDNLEIDLNGKHEKSYFTPFKLEQKFLKQYITGIIDEGTFEENDIHYYASCIRHDHDSILSLMFITPTSTDSNQHQLAEHILYFGNADTLEKQKQLYRLEDTPLQTYYFIDVDYFAGSCQPLDQSVPVKKNQCGFDEGIVERDFNGFLYSVDMGKEIKQTHLDSHLDYTIGKYETYNHYTNGTYCATIRDYRQAAVNWACGKELQLAAVYELQTCEYMLEITSPNCCESNFGFGRIRIGKNDTVREKFGTADDSNDIKVKSQNTDAESDITATPATETTNDDVNEKVRDKQDDSIASTKIAKSASDQPQDTPSENAADLTKKASSSESNSILDTIVLYVYMIFMCVCIAYMMMNFIKIGKMVRDELSQASNEEKINLMNTAEKSLRFTRSSTI